MNLMSTPTQIIYEYPLEKKVRHFVKIESLFTELDALLQQDDPLANYHAIFLLHSLLNILEKNDIRSDIIKELERQTHQISTLIGSDRINGRKLNVFLTVLNKHITIIRGLSHNVADSLKKDDFLNTIRQKMTNTDKLCSFEHSGFYFWLQQPRTFRERFFKQWLTELRAFQESIHLIMQSTRESTLFSEALATQGRYDRPLQKNVQLIRIAVPTHIPCFPEISANKHWLNIGFKAHDDVDIILIAQDVPFSISCCGL